MVGRFTGVLASLLSPPVRLHVTSLRKHPRPPRTRPDAGWAGRPEQQPFLETRPWLASPLRYPRGLWWVCALPPRSRPWRWRWWHFVRARRPDVRDEGEIRRHRPRRWSRSSCFSVLPPSLPSRSWLHHRMLGTFCFAFFLILSFLGFEDLLHRPWTSDTCFTDLAAIFAW